MSVNAPSMDAAAQAATDGSNGAGDEPARPVAAGRPEPVAPAHPRRRAHEPALRPSSAEQHRPARPAGGCRSAAASIARPLGELQVRARRGRVRRHTARAGPWPSRRPRWAPPRTAATGRRSPCSTSGLAATGWPAATSTAPCPTCARRWTSCRASHRSPGPPSSPRSRSTACSPRSSGKRSAPPWRRWPSATPAVPKPRRGSSTRRSPSASCTAGATIRSAVWRCCAGRGTRRASSAASTTGSGRRRTSRRSWTSSGGARKPSISRTSPSPKRGIRGLPRSTAIRSAGTSRICCSRWGAGTSRAS